MGLAHFLLQAVAQHVASSPLLAESIPDEMRGGLRMQAIMMEQFAEGLPADSPYRDAAWKLTRMAAESMRAVLDHVDPPIDPGDEP